MSFLAIWCERDQFPTMPSMKLLGSDLIGRSGSCLGVASMYIKDVPDNNSCCMHATRSTNPPWLSRIWSWRFKTGVLSIRGRACMQDLLTISCRAQVCNSLPNMFEMARVSRLYRWFTINMFPCVTLHLIFGSLKSTHELWITDMKSW